MATKKYLGLQPYTESDAYRFKGRRVESKELFHQVICNDYTVCYAESGEGKTSLLNAGLFPLLRENMYFPIAITFTSDDYKVTPNSFDSILNRCIKDSIDEYNKKHMGVNIEYRLCTDAFIGMDCQEHLLTELSKHSWWKLRNYKPQAMGLTFAPVFIFDQFEEVFSLPSSIVWTKTFFDWLEKVSSDSCPDEIAEEVRTIIGQEAAFPIIKEEKDFKAIFLLRKEYIGELDYWGMQKCFIPELKDNRYCLKALTYGGAREVMAQQECFEKKRIEQILNYLVKKYSKEPEKTIAENLPAIPALLLSVVCDSWEKDIDFFSFKDEKNIDNTLNVILERFYNDVISSIVKDLIEDNDTQADIIRKDIDTAIFALIDANGKRERKKITSESLMQINFDKKYKQVLWNNRIIKVTKVDGEEYVELVHDALCPVIASKKEQRIAEQAEIAKKKAEEAKKLKDQREEMTSSLFLLALLVFGIWVLSIIYRNKEVADNIRIYDTKTILTIANLAILPFIFYSSIKKLKTSFWLSLYGIISNVILTYFFLFGQTNEMGLRRSISVFAIGVPIVSLFYSFKFKLYGIPDRKERETINTSISLWSFWWLMSFYIFYLTVFNAKIWLPNPSTSCWGVIVIPFLTYEIIRICFKQQRHKVAFWGIYSLLFLLAFNTLKFCKPFLFSDHNIVLAIIFAILLFFIWAYKDLSWGKRIIAVTVNFMLLCVVVILNLGFNPLKVNYNSVSHVYNWIDVTVQDKDGHYGIVSACSGDTILPCRFDSIDYKEHYCYINSRKLTYNTDVKSNNGYYEYKKTDAIAKCKFLFIDTAELNILECKNARDTTHFDSLHIYAAKTYYEIRNNNLNYLVSGKRYLLDDLKAIDTFTRLQNKEMAVVLKKMRTQNINDSLVAAFNKEFARSFYLCILKDRILQQDSVNIFSLTQEMFLLYFYNAADFEHNVKNTNTINFNSDYASYHRTYKSTYKASDLRKDKVDSWYNYVCQLLYLDMTVNAENYTNNKKSRLINVLNNLQNIHEDLKKKSNQNLDKMLEILQKGNKISQEDIKEAIETYQNQLTLAEDVKNQVNTQIDQVEIEKRKIDYDFQKLICDVFETLSYIVLSNQNIYNAGFVNICEQLYIVSTLRQYDEIAPIYMQQLEEMDNAKNGLYLELKKFQRKENEYLELVKKVMK